MNKKHGKRHTAEQIIRKLRVADTFFGCRETCEDRHCGLSSSTLRDSTSHHITPSGAGTHHRT